VRAMDVYYPAALRPLYCMTTAVGKRAEGDMARGPDGFCIFDGVVSILCL
jgi:hypothetical protein